MKTITVVAAVIRSGERVFATQRGYGADKDSWEFPGGKIEPGETPQEALIREIREELDTVIRVGDRLAAVEYDYPDFHLRMDCFWASVVEGALTLKEHEAARWLAPEELDNVAWLPADRTVVQRIKECLSQKEEPKQAEAVTISDDGILLRAVLERPRAERCPLVIVLHGFTSNKEKPHTRLACEAMRDAGFATLRADLYGHGESGGEFRKHTLYKWISNTFALIDWARRQDFVTEVWLSGHSQGGLTAALVGGMAPELVRGLILRAPAFLIPEGARRGELLGRRFDPARIPDEFPAIKGLTLEGTYIRTARTLSVEDAIDRFPGPVLLLQGEEDDLVPLRDSEAAAARYRSCRLALLPGETHHFDRDPARMYALIRDWLRERQGTGDRAQTTDREAEA